MQITLVDGSVQNLDELDSPSLEHLHWEQERAFADRIRQSPRQSVERAEAFSTGYDTITKILAHQDRSSSGGLVMGFNPRYVKLVVKLLKQAQSRGAQRPRLFEIGYGSDAMLADVVRAGFDVGGIEVSGYMRE